MSMNRSEKGEKILIIPKRIVTADSQDKILRDQAVGIIDDKISAFISVKEIRKDDYDEVYDARNLTLIPGFIQTHVHLSQTLFRGLAEGLPLLDWLRLKIFPFENAAAPNDTNRSFPGLKS